MDNLIASLDKLLRYQNEDPSRFYTFLSRYRITDQHVQYFVESFIPKVYYLYDKEILRKDLVYLALLAGGNYDVLNKFLNYDRLIFSLNIQDPVSLFDYFIYEQKHFIYEIVNKPDVYDKLLPTRNIYNKINMIKFILETNLPKIDIDCLHSLSTQINTEILDDFWKFYVEEVTRFIDTVRFTKLLLKSEVSNTDLFSYASQKTLLDTLSNYVDLNDTSQWEIILEKLRSLPHQEEFNIFTGFVILTTLIKFLILESYNITTQKKDFVNNIFENVKTWILELQNKKLQVEILENIFYLMFHRSKNDFTCREKEIRFILFLIKSTIEDLQLKKTYEKSSQEFRKITNLNNHVTDALWRLDLILNTKMTPKIEEQLLSYMLAPPDSLIHICLKRRNFERAHQVIEIFNLRESDLAHLVNYSEVFLKFRKFLRKNEKLNIPIDKLVEEFFRSNESYICKHAEELIEKLLINNEYLRHFKSENATFMNIFDLALTGGITWEESNLLITLAQKYFSLDSTIKSNLLNFYDRIIELSRIVGPKDNISLPELLVSPRYPLHMEMYQRKQHFYETLSKLFDDFQNQINTLERGVLNRSHPSHKTMQKMNEICSSYVQESTGNKDSIQYLNRVFNYLKAFSRILYIEQNTSEIISNGKNTSYFEILNFNRSELTGKLLFERQLDPTEFEKYFGKLKLDFLYHVVGNCFPTINLHVQENITIEELYHDNMMFVPSPSIIIYIQKRNWLLAFILSEMYKVKGVKIDISEVRLRTFFNYLKMPKIQHLKALYEKNDIIAALQNCINAQTVRMYLREQMVEHDLISLHSEHSNNSNECLETAEEVFEDTKISSIKTLYDIVDSIPENQVKKNADFIISKDNLLVNLVHDGFEPEYYKYAYFISDRNRRIDTILNNFKKWPGKSTCDIIRCEISRFDCLLDSKIDNLRNWLQHIELNEELKNVFDLKSWYRSYNFCKDHPESALEKILLTDKVDSLLNFIKLYKPSESILSSISSNYMCKIMDLNIPLESIKILLDTLPFQHAIDICHNLLTILKNVEQLQFIADYLNNNVTDDVFLKSVQVSLKMLTVFSPTEQEQLFCLINEPLSILEVLLMNTKLDKIASILDVLNIQNSHNFSEEIISVNKIDELLRKYAEKSLDFRVITHPLPRLLRTPEAKLLQSLDSLSLASDRKQFVIPENVPTKEEWVKNDEVVECMCCHQVTFSMFSRRHHCRRCGRVVCYYCSLKRMLVPTYEDIMVRVCSDCYSQTIRNAPEKTDSNSSNDFPSTRSFIQEYWLLNDDPEHNKIIREEFSYEHAPSTSLCFSILKYHSKSAEYPKFLLEQCEVMLKLLQPNQEPTHEIDYLLVIKMLKSLAMAAKMVPTESVLASGASMADKIISQAELLALLAERGCLNLMPLIGTQNLYIDSTALRRLRDKLLQREQWNLALEVSTKAGLDNSGVFAAWGKSCLKAGSLLLARDKFQKCLEKNKFETSASVSRHSELTHSLDSLSLNFSKLYRVSSSSNHSTGESRPSKDPPLLHEIIQILETKTRAVQSEVIEKAQRIHVSGSMSSLNQSAPFTIHTDTAISVINRIQNLNEIAAGNFSYLERKRINPYSAKPTIEPIFYEECIYYLTRYGTHLSLLEFYIRHGDFQTALLYILENRLNPEIFTEIYLKCLKDGSVAILQEYMSRIDSSLDVWKDYLRQLCRTLEKHHLLNSLYQLQLYIGDYVRASMTCIRFYEGVKTFTELANNVAYLYKGEEHLRQILEQEQWVEVASVGTASSTSKDSFEERMLSNPDLVMKIDTKDVNRHINTVKRQVEIVNFLSQCESAGANTRELLRDLISFKDPNLTTNEEKIRIPTLFGSPSDKINLAVMAVISGATVEEGFKLATKIIEEFNLRPIKVYCLCGKQFAKSGRYNGILQLVNCIKSTGINDSAISDMLDEMLAQAVGTLIKANVTGTKVEDLIKLIKDKAMKISAYIEAKQLKTAYFLAVKYKRTADIRRIQREAELLNMPTIKALCQKVLQNSPHTSMSHSKDS